ncbi:PD-(D/E)XK nuclease family protein [bacterium]|nr:PD-(D/E)XK nuclease family protein [bacterium]
MARGAPVLKRWIYWMKKLAKNVYRWFFACPDRLSFSKISSYLSCPQKYEFEFKKKKTVKYTPMSAYGTIIHRVLEAFHTDYDVKTASEDELFQLLDENWIPAGFPTKEEDERFRARGRDLLRRYLAHARENPAEVWRTELFVTGKIGGVDVVGQMDRIDQEPDGTYTIIDYKTGDKKLSAEGAQNDLQANIYYLLGETSIGKKFKNFFFWYLERDEKVPVTITDEARKETTRVVRKVAHDMQYADVHPRKGVLCNWCDFYERCPAWKERPERLYKIVRESEDRMGLSYSKMSSYENCPMAYKKLYIDKVGTKPKWFFSIGHTVHQTMEEFYMYDGPLAEPSLSWLLKLYHEHWIGRGYDSKQHEEETKREAEGWMRNYYDKYVKGKFRRAYAVEEYFELPLGRHVIIGYIDRLEQNDDGTVSLYDYKTDPVMRTQADVNKDRQLFLYAWACKKLGIPLRDQTLLFVKFNEHITTTHTEKDIEEFEQYVIRVADEMVKVERAAKTLPTAEADRLFPPKINKYCGGCDYLPICPKREEILTQHKDKIMHKVDETKIRDREPESVIVVSDESAAVHAPGVN